MEGSLKVYIGVSLSIPICPFHIFQTIKAINFKFHRLLEYIMKYSAVCKNHNSATLLFLSSCPLLILLPFNEVGVYCFAYVSQ